MGFLRPEYWSGLPLPSPADLPDPGIEPRSSISATRESLEVPYDTFKREADQGFPQVIDGFQQEGSWTSSRWHALRCYCEGWQQNQDSTGSQTWLSTCLVVGVWESALWDLGVGCGVFGPLPLWPQGKGGNWGPQWQINSFALQWDLGLWLPLHGGADEKMMQWVAPWLPSGNQWHRHPGFGSHWVPAWIDRKQNTSWDRVEGATPGPRRGEALSRPDNRKLLISSTHVPGVSRWKVALCIQTKPKVMWQGVDSALWIQRPEINSWPPRWPYARAAGTMTRFATDKKKCLQTSLSIPRGQGLGVLWQLSLPRS